MSDDISAMVGFLRTEYAEAISRAREIGNVLVNVLVTRAAGELGLSADRAERQAQLGLHSAEMRAQFFEETVVPYLGTAGPTGRIAEQQLRLLAREYLGRPGFDERWAL
ncbi:hypothetical protein PV724_44185 [Streptomyces europaeiscabiei]|uniref:hypothetical protein n=1 Tax=Streptomyces europaeiscabiei TaxID=146819 RepID=UPI0029A85CAE|nr:hypothetical protein [Streptomyces europaeiscabiei]MDX3549477.1 hypothetical protein [Streptomyces europaeiscabiei]